MNLATFTETPCAVCGGSSFTFFYGRKFKETQLNIRGDKLFGYLMNIDFLIDPSDNTLIVLSGNRDYFLRFRILKECNYHYRASTNYINVKTAGKLSNIDGLMYEEIYIKLNEGDDERVPEGGGTIHFTNNYAKNETNLMTVGGYKKLPIVSLDKFDFKNPIDILDKLESLMVLL